MEPISVRVDYWTYPNGSLSGEEPEGIEKFRSELQETYVSLVKGQSGALGGGLYDLVVQVTSSISLRDFVDIILGGVAYDLVKGGAHSFILRPLIAAIKKLKAKNKDKNIEVDELKFFFQDTDIILKKVTTKSLFDDLEQIVKTVAKNYEAIKGPTGEPPYEIHIPVFEDPSPRFCRYRSLLDVDETIEDVTADSYLRLWGTRYNLEGQIRVFDVQKQILINERYMTQDEYWQACELEWAKDNDITQPNN